MSLLGSFATAFLLFCALCASSAVGAPLTGVAPPVAVSPVDATLAAGATGNIGVRMEIAPGYHVYTDMVEVSLVAAGDITVSAPVYPPGEVVPDPADATQMREQYEGAAQVQLKVSVPVNAAAGSTHAVQLKVRYQACTKNLCAMPAEEELSALVTVPKRAGFAPLGEPRSRSARAGPLDLFIGSAWAGDVADEVAVIFTPGPARDDHVVVHVDLQGDWHLNKMFMGVTLVDAAGRALGEPIYPPAHPSGKVEDGSYREDFTADFDLAVPITGPAGAASVEVDVGYQACKGVSLCRMPTGEKITVPVMLTGAPLPAAGTPPPSAEAAAVAEPAVVAAPLVVAVPVVEAPVASASSIGKGAGLMFAFSLGMGMIFLVTGMASGWLPSRGPWMVVVKKSFGIIMWFGAIYYAAPQLPLAVTALSTALVCIVTGVFSWPSEEDGEGWLIQRLRQSWTVIGVVAGSWLLVATLMTQGFILPAMYTARAAGNAIVWGHDEAAALREAQASGKPVIIDFTAEWCAACHEMERLTYTDPAVVAAAEDFVTVMLDCTKSDDPAIVALQQKYGVKGLPAVVLLSSTGQILQQTQGFVDAPDFKKVMDDAKAGVVSSGISAFDAAKEQGFLALVALCFLAGIGVSFTPCVLPMVPITMGMIGARGASSRVESLMFTSAYVLGLASVYTALGVFAGVTGALFGGWLQSPWVVGGIAVFFVAMGASMFGFFDVQLPAALAGRLQSGERKGGYMGAFVVGTLGAVVAGPCSGPVVVSILALIGTG